MSERMVPGEAAAAGNAKARAASPGAERAAGWGALRNAVAAREASQDAFFKEVWENLQSFRTHYREWGGRAFLPRRSTLSH